MKHLLYVPFTGLGLHNGYRGDHWLKNRIQVFREFVVPSLIHQSNRNFTLWVSWRPEEEGNSLVMGLERTFSSLRDFPFIFTYGGLCFEDDKYDRPMSLDRLRANLKLTLPKLYDVVGKEEEVLMTIQPSDDMYLSHAIEEIQEKLTNTTKIPTSFGYDRGYIMNYSTLEVAEYNPDTIPPFFSVSFPRAVFLDPEAHMKWTGPYRSHEYIKAHTLHLKSIDRGFIVGTHGENISTTWNVPYKGHVLEPDEKEKVLLQVGLFNAQPLTLKKDPQRERFNRLPAFVQRFLLRRKDSTLGSAINTYRYFKL